MLGTKNATTAKKLVLLVLVSLLSLAAVMVTSTVSLRRSLDGEKMLQSRSLVDVAYGVIEHYHALAKRGVLRDEDARAAAIAAIRELRYEGQGYFWISDLRSKMVMHPFRPDLEGTDLSNERDPTGTRPFAEFSATVRQRGEGYVEYLWPRPGVGEPVRKISYVRGFEPWGWIVGSGVFLDDVDALFRAQAARFLAILAAIACLFGVVAWRIARSILAPLGAEPAVVADIANRVADGDLDIPLETASDGSSVLHAMTRMVRRLKRDVQMAEEELARASRLDGIGRLAGGIAHDFNNLLVVVLACVNTLREALGPDHPMHQEVAEIDEAAHRAAALTRQLLAFGRRDVIQPVTLDLNGIVSEASRMLRRIVGEDVTLAICITTEPAVVVADAARLQQVILNLVVNARDAMPRGGTVTIETHFARIDAGHAVLPPGDHVVLAIRDSGCGMSAEVRQHLFEPFFTTKREGRGTGLGLATVFGIVKQAGGHIEVESAPGEGSCFRVYLPRAQGRSTAEGDDATAASRAPGGESILLVEDEPSVLKRAAVILERAGYHVVTANGPEQAILLHARCPGAFDLLLTDVIMPGMSGPQLADRLVAKTPGLRVLFMSGYTDEYVSRDGTLLDRIRIVEKPFDSGRLLAAVGEALDATPAAAARSA
ncbi:cache domain-containing protein [Anaeromyxobacter oryzae]|uniref:histidine kinase n=1 Tax=Anaeromyxobacter oryzae TaxID=2918170 RepID=A0ABN6MUW3_9BACT|nr:cache domain-containing protein [Anaeromyxobacter oryzae]BDG03543.1 hypothetical protein AMOR_25390 [Anaeromyxobacter oryzae]